MFDIIRQNNQNLDLIVAIDGPKTPDLLSDQEQFIEWLYNHKITCELVIRKNNLGLKQQIIKTLNYLSGKYSGFIVLEEDLRVSSHLIQEMTRRLRSFEYDERIWSINAYTHPLMGKRTDYLTSFTTSWGWATWSNRWQKLITDDDVYLHRIVDWRRFNFNNTYDYKLQLLWNIKAIKKTWAVYWYATIYINGGDVLQMGTNQVLNNGFYSGENFSKGDNAFFAEIDGYLDTFIETPVRFDMDPAIEMFNVLNNGFKFAIWRMYQRLKMSLRIKR